MKTDGDLPDLFKRKVPGDYQKIESWGTGQGVPDLNFCIDGKEGWIEAKLAGAWAVHIEPEQVGWAERRLRAGGRVFLAVRRVTKPGPRTAFADELWLFHGSQTRTVKDGGLRAGTPLGTWTGGPARWEWTEIRRILTSDAPGK